MCYHSSLSVGIIKLLLMGSGEGWQVSRLTRMDLEETRSGREKDEEHSTKMIKITSKPKQDNDVPGSGPPGEVKPLLPAFLLPIHPYPDYKLLLELYPMG